MYTMICYILYLPIYLTLQGRPIIKDAESDYPEDRNDVLTAPRDQLLHASLSTLGENVTTSLTYLRIYIQFNLI